jgi:hypothetical protein
MNVKLVLTTSLFIVGITIVFSVQSVPVISQGDLTSKTVILRDDLAGNQRGWDPNGTRTTFWINDEDVAAAKSTVLVNTIQKNYVICSVDSMAYSAPGFEVKCINESGEGPSNGGELHYTVFSSVFTIEPTGPLSSAASFVNQTDVMPENRTALAEGNTAGG